MKEERSSDGQPAGPTGLEHIGLTRTGALHVNLSVPALIGESLARGEGALTATGALCARTAPRTGRSPKDKFVVRDAATESTIEWGSVNQPISQERFDHLLSRAAAYLQGRDLFVCDAWAGAEPAYRMPIRVVTEYAWHSLFARQLFRRPSPAELATMQPEFTIVSAPGFHADPATDGTRSEVAVCVSLARRAIVIMGTRYAGEIKKSIFTILNYLLPDRGVFPMHCSANIGPEGDAALFFGLSGTGKTTLSADPSRHLIGDDEHGWSDHGVFNFEGGCYAKCIKLSAEREPQIYNALRFGAVLENVVIDPASGAPDFDDDSLTENTRAAYPVEYISNAVREGYVNVHPKSVIFLTCDAFGVLPPISRLSTPQAMYHFLSGYTARMAGTEAGMGSEPSAVFSACFGAPFLPRRPMVYAEMLAERVRKHASNCYLINTGWSGGPCGVGERIKLPYTRAMIDAVLNNRLADGEFKPDPIFGLATPSRCPGVPSEVLQPRATWKNGDAYDTKARELAGRFRDNFKSFTGVSREVFDAGPRLD